MKPGHVALCLLLGCGPASAADFDGTKMLICAPVEAMDCVAGRSCARGLPEEIGAPSFIRIDMAQKVIVGPKQNTPILFVEKGEQQILLQGKELSYAWTISLDQESGKLVGTLVDSEGVFVLFGACTPL